METLQIKTTKRCELQDVTDRVAQVARKAKDAKGVLVFVPHTTAGVTINENADPSVPADILNHLEKLVPQSANFRHGEGNSDAHIKSSMMGQSLLVPVEGGELVLGTWQGIFFAEFDGPRSRKLHVKVI